jgi:hypothetical protein
MGDERKPHLPYFYLVVLYKYEIHFFYIYLERKELNAMDMQENLF